MILLDFFSNFFVRQTIAWWVIAIFLKSETQSLFGLLKKKRITTKNMDDAHHEIKNKFISLMHINIQTFVIILLFIECFIFSCLFFLLLLLTAKHHKQSNWIVYLLIFVTVFPGYSWVHHVVSKTMLNFLKVCLSVEILRYDTFKCKFKWLFFWQRSYELMNFWFIFVMTIFFCIVMISNMNLCLMAWPNNMFWV